MAKPIEPTPMLDGEDAERLLVPLAAHASPDEMRRRTARAAEIKARMKAPKTWYESEDVTDGESSDEDNIDRIVPSPNVVSEAQMALRARGFVRVNDPKKNR